MGEVNSYLDSHLQTELQNSIARWHDEVARLLPTLPAEIHIQFDNTYLTPGYGVGGIAWAPHTLKLAYDPSFDGGYDQLMLRLKAVNYHERYHLASGISFLTTPHDLPAINHAVQEGTATKFEVIRANSSPGWAQYEDRTTMLSWLDEVRKLPDGFDYDWRRWKFFDPETGRKWILYKVGLFVVDETLKRNPKLTIEAMATLSEDKILELSGL